MKADEILKKTPPSSTPKWCLFLHGLIVDLACAFILAFLFIGLIVGGFAIAGAYTGSNLGEAVLHFFGSNLINPTSALIYAAIVTVRFCYIWRKNAKSNTN